MALLNVGTTIVAWLALTFTVCLHLRGSQVDQFNPLVLSLIFFNGLNILIALCEIALGRHIDLIKSDYEGLRKKYRGTEWDACVAFLTMPLTPAQVFDMRSWSKMWSTYALYDPSYQNSEAFGFFIDVGNGWSTIPTSLLALVALVRPDGTALEGYASPLVVGCVGIGGGDARHRRGGIAAAGSAGNAGCGLQVSPVAATGERGRAVRHRHWLRFRRPAPRRRRL